MNSFHLLLALVAAACAPSREPFSEPAVLTLEAVPERCEGLDMLSRLRIAGAHIAVASDGRSVFSALGDAVAVYDAETLAPGQEIHVPGEPRALLLTGDDLWVAAGTAGLVRVPDPTVPDEGRFDTWATGGEIVDLIARDGALWAADAMGRVLVLPLDAAPGSTPEVVPVDGLPRALAVWRDGAIVAARAGGLRLVSRTEDGRLVERTAGLESGDANRVATSDTFAWIAGLSTLTRWDGETTVTVPFAEPVASLEPSGDGVLIAARQGGLFFWDGGQSPPTRLLLPGTTGRPPISPEALVPAGDGAWWLAGGTGGTALIAGGTTGAMELRRASPPGGVITALEPIPGGLALGLGPSDAAGELMLASLDSAGVLTVIDRLDAGGPVSALSPLGSGLVVARSPGGVGFVDLSVDPGARTIVEVALRGHNVIGLGQLSSGFVAAVTHDKVVTWLDPAAEPPWPVVSTVTDPMHTGWSQGPVAATVLGERFAYAWPAHGVLSVADAPGRSPRSHALAGSDVRTSIDITAVGGLIWVPVPRLGVQVVDPVQGLLAVERFVPGGQSVAPYGDMVAVATGKRGLSLVQWTGGQVGVIADCDLPGVSRFVASNGSHLFLGSAGSIGVYRWTGMSRASRAP